MNPYMLAHFREKLTAWRDQIFQESSETIELLRTQEVSVSDPADWASSETERALELRTRDRERKLLVKINKALERIEQGTYGYCEETGESISIERLEARPIATLSLEAQERHEREERQRSDA